MIDLVYDLLACISGGLLIATIAVWFGVLLSE
jgi:hypothetical protein